MNVRSKEQKLEGACRCLRGIAHPIRLAVLMELKKGEASVSDIAARIAGVSQSNLSQHLAKMQGCGLLVSRREGAQVFYDVADERVFELIALMENVFCKR